MDINLETYNYHLPEDRIAKYPKKVRSDSNLLAYQGGDISHHKFSDIVDLLPSNAVLLFNDTKVIQARLPFSKRTGARIEIFCLEPLNEPSEYGKNTAKWYCLVGNRKKWKEDSLVATSNNIELKATIVDFDQNRYLIQFDWTGSFNFFEILEIFGVTPLPPYLNRIAIKDDTNTYQTVYAKHDGAVAAPTAGLHFTDDILEQIQQKGIKKAYSTLHVGAGTFQPIKDENVLDHPMHEERISFKREEIANLIAQEGPVITVGTTSLRSLESLYWYGVMLNENFNADFDIQKLYPYSSKSEISYQQSFELVLKKMKADDVEEIWGKTSIFIFPSYKFRVIKGLITNYHQPKSTLILLVAALIGEDWKKVYKEALNNNYRFLSYGDSSLLLPNI